MKLLFDQNLSPKLVTRLSSLFPGSTHVQDVRLDTADDIEIWDYARSHDYIIISKDTDFRDRSVIQASPPRVIWIRRGNCSTDTVEELLRVHYEKIESFAKDPDTDLLLLL